MTTNEKALMLHEEWNIGSLKQKLGKYIQLLWTMRQSTIVHLQRFLWKRRAFWMGSAMNIR